MYLSILDFQRVEFFGRFCLLHLIQCQNANGGGVHLGEMKTRQNNPRTQLQDGLADSRAANETSVMNELHIYSNDSA